MDCPKYVYIIYHFKAHFVRIQNHNSTMVRNINLFHNIDAQRGEILFVKFVKRS